MSKVFDRLKDTDLEKATKKQVAVYMWLFSAETMHNRGITLPWAMRITMKSVDKTSDWTIYYRVFPREWPDHKIEKALNDAGYMTQGQHCTHSYDCCGKWYSDGLYITRKGSRALAKIGWSQNV